MVEHRTLNEEGHDAFDLHQHLPLILYCLYPELNPFTYLKRKKRKNCYFCFSLTLGGESLQSRSHSSLRGR